MSIVVTTPTGNIGSAVTRTLLDAGERPLLVARDPGKLQESVDRGAEVVRGSHEDADLLTEATRDAQALFVLTPPDFGVQDIHGHYRRFAEAAAAAIRANGIEYVVHLSSVGADLESGNGPVAGLFVAEKILNESGAANLVHLRPAYFMENTLMQIPNILQAGSLYSTFPGDVRFPTVATRDIGAKAAELLRVRDWSGTGVVELKGPRDMSYDDIARILAGVLDRKVGHVTVSDEQLVQALTSKGMSLVLAKSFTELAAGLTEGRVRAHEPRSDFDTNGTTYAEFAKRVFKPAFDAAVQG